jgi:hypothetical protein
MSGIQMALLAASPSTVVIVGNATLVLKQTYYYYGYDAAVSSAVSSFGDIDNGTFSGATIKAIYSTSPANTSGQAASYSVYFNGNRSAGFFNTLTVNGTLVTGTLGSPVYNSPNDETVFTITLASSAATLFGTTDLVRIPTILT